MVNKAGTPLNQHPNYNSLPAEADRHNLFYQIERETIKPLIKMLDDIFDQLEESLFDAANSAQNQQEQNLHFACMEELRSKRSHSHTRFRHYLTQNFRLLVQAERQLWKSSIVDLYGIQDFEIEVSINNIVTRARCAIPGPLLYLLTRINALLPNSRVVSSTNPLDPKQIVTAFVLAVAPLKFDTSLRLALLKHFDSTLLQTLRHQVEHANRLLIDSGYCPDIDAKSIRHARYSNAEQPSTQQNNTPQNSRQQNDNDLKKTEQENCPQQTANVDQEHPLEQKNESRNVVEAGPIEPHLEVTAKPTPNHYQNTENGSYSIVSKQRLFQLIDYLQRCQSKRPLSLTPLQAHPIINHLLTSSTVLHERRSLSRTNEKIIQLMDIAFRFIYSQGLPQVLLGLVAKLQLPILKVALCDPGFLSNRNHPARQLVNALTTMGIDWNRDDHSILRKGINYIVERLSSELYGDPHLFQQLATSLIQEQKSQLEKASKLELRVLQGEIGKDKTEHCRRLANQLLSDRMQGKKIHPQCVEFLLGPWQQVLFQQTLKFGENSQDIKSTLAVTQDLIALSIKNETNHVSTLGNNKMSGLLHAIHDRLKNISSGQPQTTKQLAQLQKTLSQASKPMPPGQPIYPIFDQTFQEPNIAIDYLKQKTVEDIDTLIFGDLMKHVDQLSPGTWFRFASKGAVTQPCKLVGRLPFSKALLFTYSNGQKAHVIAPEQLASQLFNATALPIHSGPLLDRALRFASNQLKSQLALHSTN